jgi:hypothetical protein
MQPMTLCVGPFLIKVRRQQPITHQSTAMRHRDGLMGNRLLTTLCVVQTTLCVIQFLSKVRHPLLARLARLVRLANVRVVAPLRFLESSRDGSSRDIQSCARVLV